MQSGFVDGVERALRALLVIVLYKCKRLQAARTVILWLVHVADIAMGGKEQLQLGLAAVGVIVRRGGRQLRGGTAAGGGVGEGGRTSRRRGRCGK